MTSPVSQDTSEGGVETENQGKKKSRLMSGLEEGN